MKKRETELDILRIAALLGVIFTHACGICTQAAAGGMVTTFLLATVTWHVPVFVISIGATALIRKIPHIGRKIT